MCVAGRISGRNSPESCGSATMGAVGHPTIASFKHEKLRRLRVQAGHTQAAMAERLGISAWSYQTWESGQHTPRPDRLVELVAILGCELTDLVDAPETLADYRTLAGYTQADLADKVGVSRVTVAQWEAGALPIAPKHHNTLTALLNVDVADL